MKLLSYLFLTVAISLIYGCDIRDDKLIFYNHRKKAVSYLIFDDSLFDRAISFYSNNNPSHAEYISCDYIGAIAQQKISSNNPKWETDFFHHDTLFLFVIDSMNINKDSITIRDSNMIKRYFLTKDYLEQNNWTFDIR